VVSCGSGVAARETSKASAAASPSSLTAHLIDGNDEVPSAANPPGNALPKNPQNLGLFSTQQDPCCASSYCRATRRSSRSALTGREPSKAKHVSCSQKLRMRSVPKCCTRETFAGGFRNRTHASHLPDGKIPKSKNAKLKNLIEVGAASRLVRWKGGHSQVAGHLGPPRSFSRGPLPKPTSRQRRSDTAPNGSSEIFAGKIFFRIPSAEKWPCV
jgi:hypothetical protein